jgi:hypothetical protein
VATFFSRSSRSGALSSSEIGLRREISIVAVSQRAPLFRMLQASVR